MIRDMLYPYQEGAVERIHKMRRHAIFDEPGLGKTITVLGALERDGAFERPYRALVLATTTGAALTWYPTAQKLLPPEVQLIPAYKGLLRQRRETVAAMCQADAPTLVIANHAFIEVGQPELKTGLPAMWSVEWDAIIVDESQRVLPTQSHQSWSMTRFWRGLWHLQAPLGAYRIPMSGTPDRGKLENRYGTWKFMLPEAFDKSLPYETWLHQNFKVTFRKVYAKIRGKTVELDQPVVIGLRDPDKWAEVDSVLTTRRTKGEVATDLPPKRYADIKLPLPSKLKKAYEAYMDEFAKEADDGSRDAADMFRVRATQFAITEWDVQKVGHGTTATPIVGGESPKRDWIIEWLEEREYHDASSSHGSKVVITSQFSAVLRWLHEELGLRGIPAAILDGSLSTDERLNVQTALQTGSSRIVLLNMSLGDSIDLDAADDMIFVDHVRDPDKTTQTEDRIHRVSRMHNVIIWRLITRGSVDELIVRTNERRFGTTRESLDGRRGIEFARKILMRLGIGEEGMDVST